MIKKFLFSSLPLQTQVRYLKKKGIGLGTRQKDGRKIYIYMLGNLFIEVYFKNDSSDEAAEKLNIISGLLNLNEYLEKEFKNNF